MTTINIRTEENVKKDAEMLFEKLGLNMSAAINIFLRKAIMENGIPFDVKVETPNAVTIAAIEEGERLLKDKKAKTYKSVDELRRELNV